VGLIQSAIEKAGIPTVSISLLREVTMRVRPPRALAVDRPLGFPLGTPYDHDLQKRIVMAALDLLKHPVQEPLLIAFPQGKRDYSRAVTASGICSNEAAAESVSAD
jgi:hypothetical protein